MAKVLVVAGIVAATLIGCAQRHAPAPDNVSTGATAARASAYDGPTTPALRPLGAFRIAVVGEGEKALARNACLRDYAEAAFQTPVELTFFRDYPAMFETFRAGGVDYAVWGASAYAQFHLLHPGVATPVATQVGPNGETGFRSVMIARAESGIASLSDMRGRSLAFTDRNSTSGFLVPAFELEEQVGALSAYFGAIEYRGRFDAAVRAVLDGEVDAAIAWTSGVGAWEDGQSAGVFRRMVESGALAMADIRQVWASSLTPNAPAVMASRLPQEARDAMLELQKWILDNDPACARAITGGAVAAWRPVDHSTYAQLIRVWRAML